MRAGVRQAAWAATATRWHARCLARFVKFPFRASSSLSCALLFAACLAASCAKPDASLATEAAARSGAPALARPSASSAQEVIHLPERLLGLPTGGVDARGEPISVACVTCHSLRRPAALPEKMSDLDEFHQGLTFRHGALACGSCHVVGDQDRLHKADGTTVPMRDAIELCAQCHGPQYRDYQRRSHGGTNGRWDSSRGPSVRNHCLDCHDAHAPRFLPSTPVLVPRDRGTVAGSHARTSGSAAPSPHAGHPGATP